jgi:hypothetical protein
MWYDCFNGCVRARSLSTAAQIKKKGEPLLIFTGLWFAICVIIFWLASEKYKIISWKKKSLKTSKISSFFLKFYFVIAEDSLYIFTMYCSSVLFWEHRDRRLFFIYNRSSPLTCDFCSYHLCIKVNTTRAPKVKIREKKTRNQRYNGSLHACPSHCLVAQIFSV